ncbi:MAG: response regulator [Clostridiales bacterium]|nr:response regulator [Clostridiales bacterium]
MYRVLIVDDEPLARMGITSMLEGCGLDVEVTGSAANGRAALALMDEALPDIVITDIRMPVMSGLELLEYAASHYSPSPAFILLTSYEDFSYARQALRFSACSYLIKMELSRETLCDALRAAIERVQKTHPATEGRLVAGNVFINRFYNNLLTGGYHSDEEILDLARHFNQHIAAEHYLAVCAEVEYPESVKGDYMQQYNLYLRVMDTIKSAVALHVPCFVAASHYERIGVVLLLRRTGDARALCECAVAEADKLCAQYFGVHLACGAGQTVDGLLQLPASFTGAQYALHRAAAGTVQWYVPGKCAKAPECDSEQALAKLDRSLIAAFEHCDIAAFNRVLDGFSRAAQCEDFSHMVNSVSCVLHVVLTCLDNGEQLLADAFSDEPQSYRSLYACTSRVQLLAYLDRLRAAVVSMLTRRQSDPKYRLVMDAKEYIRTHICAKLSLGEVACAIGISQNYLSGLFRQYSELGFNDYVTSLKVETAKKMLTQEHLKVYQVSERLGFENAHYFSKVYKKFTGYSPSEVTRQSSAESKSCLR